MDPILRVILYFLDKNKYKNHVKVDSIKSFFKNGILFPKFVSLAFNADEIPNIHPNPSTDEEKDENNQIALQFLTHNFSPFIKSKPSIQTDLDQISLLKTILIKKCFPLNEQDILHKCNIIVNPLRLHFANMNELNSWKSLILLLKVLSNEEFDEKKFNTDNLYQFVQQFFKQCKAPLVIDENSLKEENRYLFLIQLQILIDFYTEKKQKITENLNDQISIENKSASINDDLNNADTDTDTNFGNGDLTEEERRKNLFPNNYDEVEMSQDQKDENQDERESSLVNEMLSKVEVDEIEVSDYDFQESSDNSSEGDNDISSTKETTLNYPRLLMILVFPIRMLLLFILRIFQAVKSIFTKKKKTNDFIVFKEMEKESLLKTINAISSKTNMNKHFDSIHSTIENDWIPKFVMHFLHVENIQNVHLNDNKNYHKLNELSGIELNNIASVIQYLKEKEAKFDVLSFNFKNRCLCDSSAVLFYSTFLNFFFLKKSRKDLFKRCVTILFPASKEEKDEIIILSNWSTYIELIYFVVYGKKMNKFSSIDENELFEKNGIPQIINKDILSLAKKYKEIPDVIYYQLQIIFDVLDTKFSTSRIIEYFLSAIVKLKEMRYPRIDFITSSIRAKNISLILQIRRHKEFEMKKQKVKEIEKMKEEEAKKDDENKEDDKNKKDEKNKEDDKNNEDDKNKKDNENKIEDENCEAEIPLKYLDRFANYSNEKQEQKEKTQMKTFKADNFYEYWNSPNSNYIYKDGILINKSLNQKENDQRDEFHDEISKIFQLYEQKELCKDKTISPQKAQLFDDPTLQNETRDNIYKLFTYDEQKKKWLLDFDNLNKLNQSIQSNSNSLKTPIVLYINSLEQEFVTMNSKLINGLYPLFEDDKNNDIFIYALCDRFLSHLNYEIDNKNNKKSKIKPIFFLLHVPKNKETHPDIQSIVTSIYSFLSNICDIEVVLLDENNYRSQLEMVEMMNKTNDLYGIKIIKEGIKPIETKKSKQTNDFVEKGTEEYYIDEIIDDDVDDALSFDSNSSESDFEYENDDRLIITQQSNKKHKTIFLINEKSHEFNSNIDNYLNQSDFFKNIKNESNTIHFIDTNKAATYKSFLDKLNEFSEECQTSFEEIKEKIEINEILNLCTSYISAKTNENWKEELEEIINKRYFILNGENDENLNFMAVISQLRREISSISLPFDSEFQEECKIIISKINNRINQKNREIIKTELEKSSNLKMKTLNKFEDYEFKSNEKVEDIKNEHINFIKEEFNDIIKILIGLKKSNIFYEDNFDILNERIAKDIDEINKFVIKMEAECDKRYVKNENEEEIEIGSNVLIRESENVRETKVQIEVGEDLKDHIEQDF